MNRRALVRSCILALGLALAPVAQAGNRLAVQHVAFNPAGTQVLLVTAGQLDGSGFSAAQLQVVDTNSGHILRQGGLQSETLGVRQTVTALLKREEAALRRWNLWPGRMSTPVYRRVFPSQAPTWAEGAAAGQSRTMKVRVWSWAIPVTLNVSARPGTCAFRDLLPSGEGPAGVALLVNGQPLYRDRALPPARACAARYALERLDVQGNRVAAVLRVYTPGFEGPDAQPLLVAGRLR
ncbi:DUF2259 domain-containing protein [Deinococcus hohokamensis]|uniref:DUF2259 domain-containing protein n=1 Tax=Deinococcus hohokamensis TaxID=309883 RepID=A0ABV9I7H4_9DEIO